ncbi:hypothetical protein ACFL0X_01005 [Nanoarchaeota archaeon]
MENWSKILVGVVGVIVVIFGSIAIFGDDNTYSCQKDNGNICQTFSGSSWSKGKVTDRCSEGSVIVEPCATDYIGTCTQEGTTKKEVVSHYYSVGYTEETAEMHCSDTVTGGVYA